MYTALLWCSATRHSTHPKGTSCGAQAMALVLVKCCNAVAEHHSNARRVGLSAFMAAFHLLLRTKAISGEARLAPRGHVALNADRPTGSINIALLEYQRFLVFPMSCRLVYYHSASTLFFNTEDIGRCEQRRWLQ